MVTRTIKSKGRTMHLQTITTGGDDDVTPSKSD